MTDNSEGIPLRQLSRLRAEMSVSSGQMCVELFPDHYRMAIEFGIVARVCIADWTRDGVLARPTETTRSITTRRMAMSLGRTPASTRRHVNLLIAAGIFASSSTGICLAATVANEALVLRYYRGVNDLFVRLIEDLSATSDLDLSVAGAPAFGVRDVIERAIDTLLNMIDTFIPGGISPTAAYLWATLTLVAVRGVTYDPVLSRLYADTIPPDELRAAISVRSLAASLSIPYATALRHVQVLDTKGLITRVGSDRWTVLKHNLQHETVLHIGTSPSTILINRVRELAMMGLSPAKAADHYLHGRPALADFSR